MNKLAHLVLAGAASGTVATLAHTAAMLVARRALGPSVARERVPPKQITSSAARRLGADGAAREPALTAATTATHFAFGAITGALYAPFGVKTARHAVAGGVLFGLAVWASSYAGWVPALGLGRAATREPPERNAMMVAAHVAWGAVLGSVFRRLAPTGSRRGARG